MIVAATALLAAGALLYALVDPATARWLPKCPVHALTGYDCPGCGSQRMLHALLNGRLADAFHANAVLLCLLPLIPLLAWVELNRTRYPRLYAKMHTPAVPLALLIIFVVWGVARNIAGI